MLPIIAVTLGDPSGVGPEIIVKAFESTGFGDGYLPLVIGDRLPVERAVRIAGSSAAVWPISLHELHSFRSCARIGRKGAIPVLTPQDGSSTAGLTQADIEFGKPSPSACAATISWVRTAVELAGAGLVDAICTCPINKEQLHRQGFPFPGHTEFIRELTGAENVVMMLCGPELKVALATIHESLADVPGLITKDLLRKVIHTTAESVKIDFAVQSPRIAVAGLNPHAGEGGKFGRCEIEIIRPVIEEFMGRNDGIYGQISGPWSADTVFRRAASKEFDAVVAMYHDQGLIPVKLLHFNEAVNVSIGLPIVRTSVDHGTAYDIAGSGLADPGSLIEAARLAASIAENRTLRKSSSSGSNPHS